MTMDRPADRPAPRLPEGRYGPARRPLPRRALAGAGGLAAAVAVGWAAYVAFGPGNPGVNQLDVGYRVVSDVRVDVTFEVQTRPGNRVVCTVRALNAGFAEVGLVDVPVGPVTKDATTVTAQVPTSERAVSGNVKACAVR